MPKYILDLHVPSNYRDCQDTSETDDYRTVESIGDMNRVPYQKRDLMFSFLSSQNDCMAKIEAGDPMVMPAEKEFPWINEGLNELKSMEIKRCSRDQEVDHFVQVLNSRAPNTEATSELLEQIVELEADLKGKLKDLSDFKDEIRELGKVLKATPSRRHRG